MNKDNAYNDNEPKPAVEKSLLFAGKILRLCRNLFLQKEFNSLPLVLSAALLILVSASACYAVTGAGLQPQISAVLGRNAEIRQTGAQEELTCRAALNAVFEASGFSWELSLLKNFEEMPEWQGHDSVIDLARLFTPKIPEELVANPDAAISEQQCKTLMNWLAQCKKGCSVRISFTHPFGPQLRLLRQNLGNPAVDNNNGTLQDKPLFSATVVFDLKDFRGRLAFAKTFGGSEKIALSTMAEETYGTVVAVNGGYSHDEKPIGILKNEGVTIWGTPWPGRSGICWNDDGAVRFADGSSTDWFTTPEAKTFAQALQAGPRLLKNGQPCKGDEKLEDKIIRDRCPRSIIGTDGNKLYLTVIDGRNNMHSSGTTIEETKACCAALGMKDALNLDGGGSSSLWWMGRTVTLPSNGGVERTLPYGILFTRPE